MSCDEFHDAMMDVLYGEEVRPAVAAGFFNHLRGCESCGQEYLELLETREMLQEWPLPSEAPTPVQDPAPRRSWLSGPWFPVLQRIAAVFLMLAGILYLGQAAGLLPGARASLTQEELQRMIHEVVVARQDESLRVIGEALLSIKEELELRDRARIESVYGDLYSMEQRWLETLEARNRLVSDRLGR